MAGIWSELRKNKFYRDDNPVYQRVKKASAGGLGLALTATVIVIGAGVVVAPILAKGSLPVFQIIDYCGTLLLLLFLILMILQPAVIIRKEKSNRAWEMLLLSGIAGKKAIWGFVLPCARNASLMMLAFSLFGFAYGRIYVLYPPSNISFAFEGARSYSPLVVRFMVLPGMERVYFLAAFCMFFVFIGVTAVWRAVRHESIAAALISALGIVLPVGFGFWLLAEKGHQHLRDYLNAQFNPQFYSPTFYIDFYYESMIITSTFIVILLNYIFIPIVAKRAVKAFDRYYCPS